jgi:mono/diheme cytochrome c family protein
MRLALTLAVLVAAGCTAPPPTERQSDLSADAARGRMLYENACQDCHTTQAHWRDQRLVRDWPGLHHQVTRWAAIAGQKWRPEDVNDVAAYLNERFYRLPPS